MENLIRPQIAILGAAATALPASLGDTGGVVPESPLPLAVVFIAFGVTGISPYGE